MTKRQSGILDGKEALRAFLGGISDYKLKKFIEMGMPVIVKDGCWLAHVDNIEEFFKVLTRKKANPNQI